MRMIFICCTCRAQVKNIRKQCLCPDKACVDVDLAEIYGYTTKALNQQVKNNKDRFSGSRTMKCSEKIGRIDPDKTEHKQTGFLLQFRVVLIHQREGV